MEAHYGIMMKEIDMIKEKYKALLDGVISAMLLYGIGIYSISIYVSIESLLLEYFIVLLCVVASGISAILNLSNKNNKVLLKNFWISFVSCICIFIMLIVAGHFININIIPRRKLNSADGIIILLFSGMYLIGSLCLRGICGVIWFIRNKRRCF